MKVRRRRGKVDSAPSRMVTGNDANTPPSKRERLRRAKLTKRGRSLTKVDPTRTGGLRRKFVAQIKRQFDTLKARIIKWLVHDDELGLKQVQNSAVLPHLTFNADPEGDYWSDGQGRQWPTSGLTGPSLSPGELATNDRSYSFSSDPAKLKAFQEWLKGQSYDLLQAQSQRDLWQRFVEAGFRKGAGRAFDDTRAVQRGLSQGNQRKLDFYDGTKEQFLRDSFGRPESVEKVQLLASRTFSELDGVTDDMDMRMTRTLADGLAEGKGAEDLAKDLADDVGFSADRAERIARTEIIRAHAEGQLDAMDAMGVEEVGVAVEFATADDSAVCPRCAAMEGVVLKLDEARNLIPLHPNCLLPGNLVQGRFTAALEAWYSGQAVEVITSNGVRVSLTVNHPVLAVGGFVKAGEVKEGDCLLCYGRKTEDTLNPDVENCPTTVEDVFKSFSTVTLQESVSSFDLNGDEESLVGQVQVVRPDLLLSKSSAGQRQSVDQVFLMPTCNSGMSSTDLNDSLLRGHRLPLQHLSLALCAEYNAGIFQPPANDCPTYTETVGQGVLRLPSRVPSADVFGIHLARCPRRCRLGTASDMDVPFNQPVPNSVRLDTQLVTQLLERFPSNVTLNQVIHVRHFHYSGPVYDLETSVGYFTATREGLEGIVIKNCRCAWLPANVGEGDEGQSDAGGTVKDTKGQIEGAADEADVDLEVSFERPKSLLGNFDPSQPRDEQGRFSVGDSVSFERVGGQKLHGTVTKLVKSGTDKGKVEVHWPELGAKTKHLPSKLEGHVPSAKVDLNDPKAVADAVNAEGLKLKDWNDKPSPGKKEWQGHKVMVSDLHDAMKGRLSDSSPRAFKEALLKAHQQRHLELSRQDNVEDRRDVDRMERSQIKHETGTFHRVNVDLSKEG